MSVREDWKRTKRERMENGTQFADHLLSTDEWADLEEVAREPLRLPYHEHQLQPNPDYSGFLDYLEVDEARALLGELIKRFPVHDWRGFPLPPTGLPGFRRDGFSEEAPAAKLLEIGIRYALAVIRSEPRAMHLRWQDAEGFVADIMREADDKARLEEIKRALWETERRDAMPQFVYFIGAQSGAIKIGLATDPQSRLKTLQTGHHEKLELLATCKGGQDKERSYHKLYADRRLNGEWFERCPEIEAEIARLNAEDL